MKNAEYVIYKNNHSGKSYLLENGWTKDKGEAVRFSLEQAHSIGNNLITWGEVEVFCEKA